MVGLGTDQIPYAGGIIDAMGKDAVVESLLGGRPTMESVDGTPHIATHGDQFYDNLARYTLANEFVSHDRNLDAMPREWLTADGNLMTPQQVLDDPRLGQDYLDDYYNNLYSYLTDDRNHNLAQYLDQFNSQFGNADKP
jgi:hypothetical protein